MTLQTLEPDKIDKDREGARYNIVHRAAGLQSRCLHNHGCCCRPLIAAESPSSAAMRKFTPFWILGAPRPNIEILKPLLLTNYAVAHHCRLSDTLRVCSSAGTCQSCCPTFHNMGENKWACWLAALMSPKIAAHWHGRILAGQGGQSSVRDEK